MELLTIWFGANDAAPPPSPQHVPRDRYKANLVHLVNMVKSPTSAYYSPDTRIILITPPPVNTYQWATRVFAETKLYAEAVREVGAEVGVPVADVWTEIWEAAGRDERACERFLQDGLHLNAAGYEVRSSRSARIILGPKSVADRLQLDHEDYRGEIPGNSSREIADRIHSVCRPSTVTYSLANDSEAGLKWM